MTKRTFFKNFEFVLPSRSSLPQVAKLYLAKALRILFKNVHINEFKQHQIIGLILKIAFTDGSIKTMSTLVRGDKTSFRQLSNLFKELLNRRSEDYGLYKAEKILINYHIFSENYINSTERESIISEYNFPVDTDETTQIKYIQPDNSFKLPLEYAGTVNFLINFKKLNPDVSDTENEDMKYRINFETISDTATKVNIILQQDNKTNVFRFLDRITAITKLLHHDIMLERNITTVGQKHQTFIIDLLNKEVLLLKLEDINKIRGFIKRILINENISLDSLKKFVTFDMECKSEFVSEKETRLKPVLICSHDFYRDKSDYNFIKDSVSARRLTEDNPVNYNDLQKFLLKFINSSYTGYKFYAHNLSKFDGIYLLTNLIMLSETIPMKVEPLYRDNQLILIKVRYGWREDQKKFRYSFEIRDSLLILLSSLKKLSDTFLKDKSNLKKLDNKDIIEILLTPGHPLHNNVNFRIKLINYCRVDCISLAHIIHRVALDIFKNKQISLLKVTTASSLAKLIWQTHHLESNKLIPLITQNAYKDISKAYTGGHTDVYKMYSDKEVFSYDYVSMYPYVMTKYPYPVGKVSKFEGNPLRVGQTLTELSNKHCFMKCDIYVDRSLNRPVYQTHINMNGITRTMAATGLFKNQWIYLPELLLYEKLTNGLTRIERDSIQCGYLFESKIIFKDYIDYFFKIKQSVTKDNPMYTLAKICMNSLYGRLGLRQELTNFNIIDNSEIERYFNDHPYINISDVIELNGINQSILVNKKGVDEVNLKSSVSIAAAVTAYARMEMAPLLLDKDLDIYYIDTDSYKSSQKITELERYKHLDHTGLGSLKFEETYSESLFLLPKVYGGVLKDTKENLIKIKGFKNKTEFDNLKDLP